MHNHIFTNTNAHTHTHHSTLSAKRTLQTIYFLACLLKPTPNVTFSTYGACQFFPGRVFSRSSGPCGNWFGQKTVLVVFFRGLQAPAGTGLGRQKFELLDLGPFGSGPHMDRMDPYGPILAHRAKQLKSSFGG